MTAPDKIWTNQDATMLVEEYITRWVGDVEYTRTDLIPALLAEARAEGISEAVKECEGWGEGRMAQLILALIDTPAPAPAQPSVQEAPADIENRIWLKAIEIVAKWRNAHPPGIMFKQLNEVMGALDNERRAALRAISEDSQ